MGRVLTAIALSRARRRRMRFVIVPTTLMSIAVVPLTIGGSLVRLLDEGRSRLSAARFSVAAPSPAGHIGPPTISIDGTTVSLDGVPVDDAAPIVESQHLMRLEGLFDALKSRRVADEFGDVPHEGTARRAELRANDDVPPVVVKSVIQTAAFAGYGDVESERHAK